MSKKEKSGNWFARHKVLTGILAIILLVIIVQAAGGGKKDGADASKSSGSSSQSSSKSAETGKIGTPIRDGKFEFTIKSVKCGVPSVSDSTGYVTKSAQGQYCLVGISVKNIGDKQQIFLQSDQKLLNASNVEYSADSVATVYNSNNNDVFVNEINPGNVVEGTLVYDLPKDQVPVTAELHDSSFSNGVKISLQ